jgi:C-terminal processing protease CtpA/Prc
VNEQDEIKARILSVKPESRAKVLVGDIVVKVNGITLASDEGILLKGKKFSDVVEAINDCPKNKIVTMDVVRPYRHRPGYGRDNANAN